MNTDETTKTKNQIVPMKVTKEYTATREETIWITAELYNNYLKETQDGVNCFYETLIEDQVDNEKITYYETTIEPQLDLIFFGDKEVILSNDGSIALLGKNEVELDDGFIADSRRELEKTISK